MGHFFPSYTFDLDNTLYFFTSGRYEYRNKGLDMYIESLYRLNQRLQAPGPIRRRSSRSSSPGADPQHQRRHAPESGDVR